MRMKNLYAVLTLTMFLSGCATKMAYLNTQKAFEEVKKDKTDCQSIIDASDVKDADLKQRKFDQCMQEKGYNVVSEEKAEKIQGLKEVWLKPGADFKAYEAIFIDKTDLTQVKVQNTAIADTKVTEEDINHLGVEMLKRFSRTLNLMMPVISNKEEATGKKVLYISLKLNSISQANVGLNVALGVAGKLSPVPLPEAPEGVFSFEGTISDFSSKEELATVADEVKPNKNSSLAGFEKFTHWQRAYNVMDYWADHLAELLAKERGQKYKSQIRIKII